MPSHHGDPAAEARSPVGPRGWIVALAGLAAAGLAAIRLRHGLTPGLDTVSYLSATEANLRGDLFRTTLAPSFSHLSAVEFLERDARVWFSDFPVGYPVLAAVAGLFTSARGGLMVMSVASQAGLGAMIMAGPRLPETRRQVLARALAMVAVLGSPMNNLLTTTALTEPLFSVAILAAVIGIHRMVTGGSWSSMALIGLAAAPAVRFLGVTALGLAVAVALTRGALRTKALATVAVGCVPIGLNLAFVAATDGGHGFSVREVTGLDLRLLNRSVVGWFDATIGDLRQTMFGGGLVPWWGWIVGGAWVLATVAALAGVMLGRRDPSPLELCLATAGLLWMGLFLAIGFFDSLVTADNRLMFPMGVVTVAGLGWAWPPRMTAGAPDAAWSRPWVPAAAAIVALGLALNATRPWRSEFFGPTQAVQQQYGDLGDLGRAIVISNDADAVAYVTGLPAAYLPLGADLLTGEPQPVDEIYAALPCALRRHGGVVVFVKGGFLLQDAPQLEVLERRALLTAERRGGVTLYRPTKASCR